MNNFVHSIYIKDEKCRYVLENEKCFQVKKKEMTHCTLYAM